MPTDRQIVLIAQVVLPHCREPAWISCYVLLPFTEPQNMLALCSHFIGQKGYIKIMGLVKAVSDGRAIAL
jgi:hypothetical protein